MPTVYELTLRKSGSLAMWSLTTAGGVGGRIPASSPPCLPGEVAGEGLGFARGQFELELKVWTAGGEARDAPGTATAGGLIPATLGAVEGN
jgi:hypothetical protein